MKYIAKAWQYYVSLRLNGMEHLKELIPSFMWDGCIFFLDGIK